MTAPVSHSPWTPTEHPCDTDYPQLSWQRVDVIASERMQAERLHAQIKGCRFHHNKGQKPVIDLSAKICMNH